MSGLIFNGNGDVIRAVDGSLTVEGLDFGGGNVEAGIGTFTTLNVTGVLTYEDVKNVDSVGIVTARQGLRITGGGLDVVGVSTFNDNVKLLDNDELKFGTGSDFKIYHTGSHSYIDNASTGGHLYLRQYSTSSNKSIILGGASSHKFAEFVHQGGVDLYHNNSKKLEITSSGVTVTGDVAIPNDSNKFTCGASGDLTIWHDGSNSRVRESGTGNLRLEGTVVELWGDGSKQLNTFANGIQVTGISASGGIDITADNQKLRIGASQDLELWHDGTSVGYIKNKTGLLKILSDSQISFADKDNGEDFAKFIANGGCELYHNNVKRFETTSSGVTVTGNYATTGWIDIDSDSSKFRCGDGQDLEIFHDGTDSYVKTITNDLILQSTSDDVIIRAVDDIHIQTGSSSAYSILCNDGASVNLYHNGTKKLETQSWGVEVNGGRIEIKGTEGGEAQLLLAADEGDDNDDNWRMIAHVDNALDIGNSASGSWEKNIRCVGNGNVGLYYDNSERFITTNNGAELSGGGRFVIDGNATGGTARINMTRSDISWGIHNETHLRIYSQSGNTETPNKLQFAIVSGGDTRLYYDDSIKFRTTSAGIKVESTGNTPTINFTGASSNEVARIDGDQISPTAGNLRFYTETSGSVSEKFRITSDGWIKAVGNNNMMANGQVYHELNSDNPNNVILRMQHDSSMGYGIFMQINSDNSGRYSFRCYNDGSDRFYIRNDGDVENANNRYQSISDIKLKENIVDAKSQWDDIKAIRVRNFNFKSSTKLSTHKQLGVVAQELELVCPGLVSSKPDLDADNNDLGTETKVVASSVLYMKAIKCLQEAMAKIEVLEAKVATLESA